MQAVTTSDIQDTYSDVLMIGGTALGCSAATAAPRAGSKVVGLEPTQSVASVSVNGVHCFDVGSRQALNGIVEEFTQRVLDHYERTGLDDTMLKSRVVALANSDVDTINAMREANAFAIVAGGQSLAATMLYVSPCYSAS